MTYYSQIKQDQFVNEHFGGMEKGTFIDIGATDGIHFNNTYFLEKEKAWFGICLEPNEQQYLKLRKNRFAISLNKAVWRDDKGVDFLEIAEGEDPEGYMLSGIVEAMDRRHKDRIKLQVKEGEYQRKKVPTVTLNQLFEKYALKTVHYCSLDTEGSEEVILKSFNFDKYDIRVFSVENNYDENGIREFMKSKGYKFKRLMWDDIYYKEVTK
jgi:FkbM family methyltransferase